MSHYLDNAATTAIRPAALEAMVPLLSETYGNPSGAHRMAREANRVLDDARETMAGVLGAEPGQIVFTAGGTEAYNLAVTGVLEAAGGVAVCSAIEHHAVLDPVQHHRGRVVAVDGAGRLDLEALEAALDPEVSLVSVMVANNETGVIQPIREVAALVRRLAPDALLHTDAVQALCWIDLAEITAEVDLLSISAHKFGGPKGVGALVVGQRATVSALLKGGGQERGRRGGTHNVPGIAAMAVAAAETMAERPIQVPRVASLRDRLADGIRAELDGVVESGVVESGRGVDRSGKTANICHLCFEGIESEALLFLLEKQDIMASAASSCSSGAMEPSHVLAAMGYNRGLAFGSLRLSLGYSSTDADVDAALATVPAAVRRLRDRG
ncbi:MAG: cysteine desulfurase family protein [Acidimicrobiales bacterium]